MTSTTSVASTAAGQTAADPTAAVREVLHRLYAAWTDNDAEAFAALYREDATVVMPGVLHRGQDAVRAYMAAAFAGPLKGSRALDEPVDIRVLGDTAVVVSTAGILLAGETEVPAERRRHATWTLHRRDGVWSIAAYANAPA
ncbi:SgcJ/EcaC family oxidoreductase [Micromonospora costi]|uniref:SgcJ/EcaC family oxidoreductase n=1 Tax=Micromonospora costi TaxID=1530042 RepID=UPI0033D003AB